MSKNLPNDFGPVTCSKCRRKYKTLAGYMRHKCAEQIRDAVEAAFDNEDKDALKLVRDVEGDE